MAISPHSLRTGYALGNHTTVPHIEGDNEQMRHVRDLPSLATLVVSTWSILPHGGVTENDGMIDSTYFHQNWKGVGVLRRGLMICCLSGPPKSWNRGSPGDRSHVTQFLRA